MAFASNISARISSSTQRAAPFLRLVLPHNQDCSRLATPTTPCLASRVYISKTFSAQRTLAMVFTTGRRGQPLYSFFLHNFLTDAFGNVRGCHSSGWYHVCILLDQPSLGLADLLIQFHARFHSNLPLLVCITSRRSSASLTGCRSVCICIGTNVNHLMMVGYSQ